MAKGKKNGKNGKDMNGKHMMPGGKMMSDNDMKKKHKKMGY